MSKNNLKRLDEGKKYMLNEKLERLRSFNYILRLKIAQNEAQIYERKFHNKLNLLNEEMKA